MSAIHFDVRKKTLTRRVTQAVLGVYEKTIRPDCKQRTKKAHNLPALCIRLLLQARCSKLPEQCSTAGQECHFGRAAKRLNIVQPALSMQIRALEEDVGGALFARTSWKVELTNAGSLFLVDARLAVAQAERAKDKVQRSLRGEIGIVRIGFAGIAVPTGRLMRNVHAFYRRYPYAELELGEMAPHLQGNAIKSGSIDIGYYTGPQPALDDTLNADHVGSWPMVVALANDHPYQKKKRISVSSLLSEPLIVYATEYKGAVLSFLELARKNRSA